MRRAVEWPVPAALDPTAGSGSALASEARSSSCVDTRRAIDDRDMAWRNTEDPVALPLVESAPVICREDILRGQPLDENRRERGKVRGNLRLFLSGEYDGHAVDAIDVGCR